VERWATNTLRTLGIVVTTVLVIGGCFFLLLIAWFVVIRGGLTQNARLFHPQAGDEFFGAILATIALVTAGIVMIVKLAKGIVRRPGYSSHLSVAGVSGRITCAYLGASGRAVRGSKRLRLGPLIKGPSLSAQWRKAVHRLLLIAVGRAIAGCTPHKPGRALIGASSSYHG
jgi:hypothetical protein